MGIKFEWGESKNRANAHKHGIRFDEAETVFLDENALLTDDPDHSDEEERFLLLGISSALKFLVVCHCYRETSNGTTIIRLINARKATKTERTQYTSRNR